MQSTHPRSRGFTLVELMVVIVILGGLIALVGPNVWQALNQSDNTRAEQQINSFKQSLDMYYMQNRKVPTNLEALTEVDPKTGEAWMTDVPVDPWGNPYLFTPLGGKKYKILSTGQDSQEGTDDDIIWPKTE